MAHVAEGATHSTCVSRIAPQRLQGERHYSSRVLDGTDEGLYGVIMSLIEETVLNLKGVISRLHGHIQGHLRFCPRCHIL